MLKMIMKMECLKNKTFQKAANGPNKSEHIEGDCNLFLL
jgi:hypothetical protein